MHMWEFCAARDDSRGAQALVEIGASQLAGRPGYVVAGGVISISMLTR